MDSSIFRDNSMKCVVLKRQFFTMKKNNLRIQVACYYSEKPLFQTQIQACPEITNNIDTTCYLTGPPVIHVKTENVRQLGPIQRQSTLAMKFTIKRVSSVVQAISLMLEGDTHF